MTPARKKAPDAVDGAEERAALEAEAAVEPGQFATLTAALADAQRVMPAIPKGKTAKVRMSEAKGGGEYSYSYADIADVLAAVRPVLGVRGLVVMQRTKYTEGGRLMLLTELRHVAGEVLDSEIELAANPGAAQQFGAALTYLRRYELVTLLGIAAEEDTDAQHVDPVPRGNGSSYGQPPKPPAWAGEASKAEKAAARAVLAEAIGNQRRGDEYAGALAKVCGSFPVAVARWLAAMPDFIGAAIRDEEETDPAAAAAQDAAAERPDPPAPEDPAGELADAKRVAKGGPLATEPEDAEAAEAEAARHVVERAGEVGAELPRDADGVVMAPGTAQGPDLADVAKTEGHADRVQMFRDYGCICPDPVSPQGPTDDLCPLVNHGIPF